MPANIQVMGGVEDQMGGIEESMAKLALNAKEVADAQLNVSGIGTATGRPVKYTTPRPPHQHQQFPYMMHHADGTGKEVYTEAERDEARGFGYRDKPYPPVRAKIDDPRVEKAELERKLAYQSQINATQQDLLQQMQERLQALEVEKNREAIAAKKNGK